jgi:hypothetical protein
MVAMRALPRLLLVLAAWLAGSAEARAQWEIFAERMPEDGSWSTYRMSALEAGKPDKVSEIRVSSRDGTVVQGVPCVWLELEPVKWLGQRNKGRLSFLIPRAMDRQKAGRLIHEAYEILFTDPVRGPWYMRPEDVRDVCELVELEAVWTFTPQAQERARDGKGVLHDTARIGLRGDLSLDPPLLRRIDTVLEGTIWRDETKPFGVVRAEWVMTERKGSETSVERRRMELLEWGRDTTPPKPIEHGDRFSYWKLIRR